MGARAAAPAVRVRGIGLVTPLGLDVRSSWAAMREGRCGIRVVEKPHLAGIGPVLAGEVDLPRSGYRSAFLDRHVQTRREEMAFRALDEAIDDAKLTRFDLASARTGIFTGCEQENTEDLSFGASERTASARERHVVHCRHIVERFADRTAADVAARLRNSVVLFNYAMACAASAVALAQAMRWLRRGRIDRAIVIGVDTPVTSSAFMGFHQLGALTLQRQPALGSRPFDLDRDGFVLAEGAGAMILERADPGEAGAGGHGWLLGAGLTNNAGHITKTPAHGQQAARAIELALRDAGLEPPDIGYVNAHATSTALGDAGETRAIKRALGEHARTVPVSAIKSMTGHLAAASGIVAAVATVLALRDRFLPPTIHRSTPDPECDLDCIPDRGREAEVDYALTNSFGFGGSNVSLIFGRMGALR